MIGISYLLHDLAEDLSNTLSCFRRGFNKKHTSRLSPFFSAFSRYLPRLVHLVADEQFYNF